MTNKEGKYLNFRIAVPEEYKDVFSHFYFAANKSANTITKTLVPSFQTILIFNFGVKASLCSKQNTEITIEKCLVLGPIKQSFDYSLPPDSQILVINFKEDSFYRFFGNAVVSENLPIDPDDLFDENCFKNLWFQLNQIDDNNIRVNYILEFCKPFLKERNVIIDKLVKFNSENLNPIKSVASQQNQTERNIQLNHKKYLGYSSKEIIRYKRFLKAIAFIQNKPLTTSKIDWFALINECGYYDQSQLTHDFKHYINSTPTKYLKFQQDICIGKPE